MNWDEIGGDWSGAWVNCGIDWAWESGRTSQAQRENQDGLDSLWRCSASRASAADKENSCFM